eukprot:445367-Prymnesium_polylepis.1
MFKPFPTLRMGEVSGSGVVILTNTFDHPIDRNSIQQHRVPFTQGVLPSRTKVVSMEIEHIQSLLCFLVFNEVPVGQREAAGLRGSRTDHPKILKDCHGHIGVLWKDGQHLEASHSSLIFSRQECQAGFQGNEERAVVVISDTIQFRKA